MLSNRNFVFGRQTFPGGEGIRSFDMENNNNNNTNNPARGTDGGFSFAGVTAGVDGKRVGRQTAAGSESSLDCRFHSSARSVRLHGSSDVVGVR